MLLTHFDSDTLSEAHSWVNPGCLLESSGLDGPDQEKWRRTWLSSAICPRLTPCSFSVPRGKVELSCPQNLISFSRSLQHHIPVLPPGENETWYIVWTALHRIPFFSKPRALMGLQGKLQVEKLEVIPLLCWYHFLVYFSLPCLPQGEARNLAGPQ